MVERKSIGLLLKVLGLGSMLALSGLLACAAVAKRTLPPVQPLARAALHPGSTTASLDALEPRFRARVQRVLERLRSEGFRPRIASTWRSPDRQELIFEQGRFRQSLIGGAPATEVRGGMSCHNQLAHGPAKHEDTHGSAARASLAIDVVPGRHRTSAAAQASFYKALGRAAKAEGLRWGGDWSKKNARWARFDLGWDPAHLQSPRCSLKARKAARRRYLEAKGAGSASGTPGR